MDSIVTALQGAFSGPGALGNILKTAVTGLGAVGNIIGQKKEDQSLNNVLKYQNNPALASQKIASMTQPLSQGLTQDVGNNVQGYLAERGLSGSPNITASTLAQALAPYQQQNQTLASQQFESLLNPAGARFAKPTDWASLMKLWMPAPATGSGSGATPQTYNPINQIGPTTPPTFPNLPSTTDVSAPDIGSWQDNYAVND